EYGNSVSHCQRSRHSIYDPINPLGTCLECPLASRAREVGMRLTRLLLGAFGLGAVSLIAASCGSSSSSDGATGSTGTGSPFCNVGGTSCKLACLEGVGCAECAANADCPASQPVCVV